MVMGSSSGGGVRVTAAQNYARVYGERDTYLARFRERFEVAEDVPVWMIGRDEAIYGRGFTYVAFPGTPDSATEPVVTGPLVEMTREQLKILMQERPGVLETVGLCAAAYLVREMVERNVEAMGLRVNGRTYRTFSAPGSTRRYLRIDDVAFDRYTPPFALHATHENWIQLFLDFQELARALDNPERHVALPESAPMGVIDWVEYWQGQGGDNVVDTVTHVVYGSDGAGYVLLADGRYVDPSTSVMPSMLAVRQMSERDLGNVPVPVLRAVAEDCARAVLGVWGQSIARKLMGSEILMEDNVTYSVGLVDSVTRGGLAAVGTLSVTDTAEEPSLSPVVLFPLSDRIDAEYVHQLALLIHNAPQLIQSFSSPDMQQRSVG